MNRILCFLLFGLASCCLQAGERVLKQSDVVTMYQGNRSIYEAYGITVLAWGGKSSPQSLSESNRVKIFGSVGMVTEFSRYYERFPGTYEEGLCRDIDGKPVKVPWLTDHQHKGVPFWWCCTQQPQFRQYLRERVVDTIKAGADGLHIDDHMGTAGGLWLGICFCDLCLKGFQEHLASLAPIELKRLGVEQPGHFNFRQAARQWLAADDRGQRKVTGHPLWPEWTVYQCHAQAAFMQELHQLANQTAGRRVPMGANAGLLWPRHLSDYKTLDLFSAETDHHAEQRRFSDLPLFAYRLADAVDRPYAATASGGDWAFIKEHNLPGLVRGWIALSYAAGHCLMTPHRQWCYTPQKGTHWYQGPTEKFAPLYQFVRRHPELFDGYETWADLGVVVPHRSFVKNPGHWTSMCSQLSSSNINYRLLLGGDDIVDHRITERELSLSPALLIPDTNGLTRADWQLVRDHSAGRLVFRDVKEVRIKPAVRVKAEGPIRILPRVKAGSAMIHLLNYQYEASQDEVKPLKEIQVTLDLEALGLKSLKNCQLFAPGQEPVILKPDGNRLVVPRLDLWGLLRVE